MTPQAPITHCGMVDCASALGHHRFEVPVADGVPVVSAHRPVHDLTLKVASLEIVHALIPRNRPPGQIIYQAELKQQSQRDR